MKHSDAINIIESKTGLTKSKYETRLSVENRGKRRVRIYDKTQGKVREFEQEGNDMIEK